MSAEDPPTFANAEGSSGGRPGLRRWRRSRRMRCRSPLTRQAGLSTIKPRSLVAKYLQVALAKYVQIALPIETMIDLSTFTIEDAIEHLKAVDVHVKAMVTTMASGKLLLTEEWAARTRERQTGRAPPGCPTTVAQGSVAASHRSRRRNGGDRSHMSDCDTCRKCSKTGHWARDCKNPKKIWRNQQIILQFIP